MTAHLTADRGEHGALSEPAPAAMTFDRMLEKVRHDGAYPTREHAEAVVRAVLAALGRQLNGADRAELAACLPAPAARLLTGRVTADDATVTADDATPVAAGAMTGRAFVADLARRTGTTPAVARWDTGSVLAAVAALAGTPLVNRLLAHLPAGYALLFGRPELSRPELSRPALGRPALGRPAPTSGRTQLSGVAAPRTPDSRRRVVRAACLPRVAAPAGPPPPSPAVRPAALPSAVGA
jgi:uncharacterized protein (DUF2267 family)